MSISKHYLGNGVYLDLAYIADDIADDYANDHDVIIEFIERIDARMADVRFTNKLVERLNATLLEDLGPNSIEYLREI